MKGQVKNKIFSLFISFAVNPDTILDRDSNWRKRTFEFKPKAFRFPYDIIY